MPTNKWLVQFELTDRYGDTISAYDAADLAELLEHYLDLESGLDTGPITVTKQEDIQTNGPENNQ
jgi:hypothetical protein